mmetsp:Transcript_11447/g.14397  ORF Transcript_11447/g.14397 Transcript_11447/m.14397 type:complete len:244 (+) Transcript_11447:402-1133(+)
MHLATRVSMLDLMKSNPFEVHERELRRPPMRMRWHKASLSARWGSKGRDTNNLLLEEGLTANLERHEKAGIRRKKTVAREQEWAAEGENTRGGEPEQCEDRRDGLGDLVLQVVQKDQTEGNDNGHGRGHHAKDGLAEKGAVGVFNVWYERDKQHDRGKDESSRRAAHLGSLHLGGHTLHHIGEAHEGEDEASPQRKVAICRCHKGRLEGAEEGAKAPPEDEKDGPDLLHGDGLFFDRRDLFVH